MIVIEERMRERKEKREAGEERGRRRERQEKREERSEINVFGKSLWVEDLGLASQSLILALSSPVPLFSCSRILSLILILSLLHANTDDHQV